MVIRHKCMDESKVEPEVLGERRKVQRKTQEECCKDQRLAHRITMIEPAVGASR